MTQSEIVEQLATQINKDFQDRPLLINVSGCTGAGKSTWAKLITDELRKYKSSVIQISEDEFLQQRNYREDLKNKVYESGEWQGKTYFENHDNWLRLDLMKEVIKNLEEGKSSTYYPYQRETGTFSTEQKTVEPTDLVVFETSIFSELFNVVILIDVDDNVLLKRKLERDKDLRDEKSIHEYHQIQLDFWRKNKPTNPDFTINNNDYNNPKLYTSNY